MSFDIIKKVSQIERCPHCDGTWTGASLDEHIYRRNLTSAKTGNALSPAEAAAKAALYGCNLKTNLKHSVVSFLIHDDNVEGKNFYQCPHCETLFHLSTGKELSEHEKSLELAILQA